MLNIIFASLWKFMLATFTLQHTTATFIPTEQEGKW